MTDKIVPEIKLVRKFVARMEIWLKQYERGHGDYLARTQIIEGESLVSYEQAEQELRKKMVIQGFSLTIYNEISTDTDIPSL